jgi:hypothetical protein
MQAKPFISLSMSALRKPQHAEFITIVVAGSKEMIFSEDDDETE